MPVFFIGPSIFDVIDRPLIYEIQCLRFVRRTYHSLIQHFAYTLHALSLVILTINGVYLPQQHKLFTIYHAKAAVTY
jgi:uncharacterized membrane protein